MSDGMSDARIIMDLLLEMIITDRTIITDQMIGN